MKRGRAASQFAFLVVLSSLLGVGGILAQPISLPWVAQKTRSDCGRAVLASVAALKGQAPAAAYAKLPSPPDQMRGYSVAEMQRFAPLVGVQLSLRAPQGLVIAGECSSRPAIDRHVDELAQMVRAGIPVIVPVESGRSRGHYLVLTHADARTFSFHDPARLGPQTVARAQLAGRMCPFGYIALVVE